jgi:hypothetical protein
MFDSVRAPGFTWAQWKQWLEDTKVIPDTITDKLPAADYVVDFGHPFNPIPWKNYEKYDEDGNPPEDSLAYRMDEKAGDKTYVEYYNEFESKTYHNTDMSAVILDNTSPSAETASRPTNRTNKFVAIGNYNPPETDEEYSEGNAEPTNPILLSSHSNPVTIITMKGRATRIGLPANPPKLLSVSGRPVVRYGEDKVVTSSTTFGAVLGDFANTTDSSGNPIEKPDKNTKVTSVYRTIWEKSYIVNGVPEAAIYETTGKPEFYS